MMPRCLVLVLVLVLALAASGCGSFIDRQAAGTTLRLLEQSSVVARREADVDLARAAMPAGVFQMEAFALAYPHERRFRDLHTDVLCQYAIAFVFDDWEDASLGGRTADARRIEERLGALLDRCIEANLVRLPPAWRVARADGPDAVLALVPTMTRAQVPAVLWLASTGSVKLALAPISNFRQLPVLDALLARCAALAPGYRDADAEVLRATLVAARAAIFGGPDGTAEFALARAAAPGALLPEVMFARGTAVARKDRALFEQTLTAVLAADVTRWPDRRLANELARVKARRYLAVASTWFPQ